MPPLELSVPTAIMRLQYQGTKMKYVVVMLLTLVAVSFSISASAQDVKAWRCEGCSASQMENLAVQKGIGDR